MNQKMDFEENVLSIKRNEKFSKLWLAATNQKAFRHCVKRSELEQIRIPAICKDILNVFSEYHTRPRGKRMTFFLAGQLVYGTVCVYREQVQCLYDYAHNLLSVQKIVFSQLTPTSSKRKAYTKEYSGKRRRVSIKFNLEVLFDNELDNIEEELQLPSTHVAPPLLRDVDWKMEKEEPEVFGPMTQEELRDFMGLTSGGERNHTNRVQTSPLSSEYQSSKKQKKNSKKKTSPSQKKMNKSKKILTNRKRSFEAIRERISPSQENNLTPINIDIPDPKDMLTPTNNLKADAISTKSLLDKNLGLNNLMPSISPSKSTNFQSPIINTTGLDLAVLNLPIPSSLDISAIKTEHIKHPKNLEDSAFDELAPISSQNEDTLLDMCRKRKLFKSHDNTNKITDENFRKQLDFVYAFKDDRRRQDIISLYKMKKKSVNTLWNNPCRSFSNKLSSKYFGKKIKLEKSNEQYILNEIVYKTKTQDPNCNSENTVVEQHFDAQNKIISSNDNIQNNLDILEAYISPIKAEFDARIETEYDEKNNRDRKTQKSRLDIHEESLLLKLIPLSQRHIKPINMKILCEGMKRKEAAITFFTIMELHKRKFLKLHKNMQNNEIYHIEMRNDI